MDSFPSFHWTTGADEVLEQRPPSRAKQPPRALGSSSEGSFIETTVFLKKLDNGFGFRIVGGREEHSQVKPLSLFYFKDVLTAKICQMQLPVYFFVDFVLMGTLM